MKNIRIKAYKEANTFLKNYSEKKDDYIIIHFARQNHFDQRLPKGSRVIAIALYYPASDKTSVYSLQLSAEKRNKDFVNCNCHEQDEIEKSMLDEFFQEVENNKGKIWLHWNMKNDNFGFQFLEKRLEFLGGILNTEMKVEDDKKKNISTLFKQKYGPQYISSINEVKGKMYALFEKNSIYDQDLLTGYEEVKEFENGDLIKVELSVISKVKSFEKLIDYAINNELITDCKRWRDIYGLSPSGIAQYVADNALLAAVFAIISGIITTILCHFIGL